MPPALRTRLPPRKMLRMKHNAPAFLQANERPFVFGREELNALPKTARRQVEKLIPRGHSLPRIHINIVARESIADHEAYLFQIDRDSENG